VSTTGTSWACFSHLVWLRLLGEVGFERGRWPFEHSELEPEHRGFWLESNS